MITRKLIRPLATLAFATLLLFSGDSALRVANAASGPRIIEITAKRFQFTPNLVTIKKGETVKLRLHSEDVTHGFFMRALKIDEEVEPGQTTEVTITPDTAGKFLTICDHFCGANHGNMNLMIVVEE